MITHKITEEEAVATMIARRDILLAEQIAVLTGIFEAQGIPIVTKEIQESAETIVTGFLEMMKRVPNVCRALIIDLANEGAIDPNNIPRIKVRGDNVKAVLSNGSDPWAKIECKDT